MQAIDDAINLTDNVAVQGVLLECAEAILLYRMVINLRYPDGTDKAEEEVDAALQANIETRRQMRLMR